jgi:hypothetical protein
MIQASQIKEEMEVIGSDGRHVGRVDHIKDSEIELAKFDFGAGLRHHLIPMSWIDDVEGGKVRLSMTVDEAKAAWKVKH